MTAIIENKQRTHNPDVDKFVTEALVAMFAKLGLDTYTNDPATFGKSMIANNIRMDNLMYPDEPQKDGIYFYKGKLLVGFVHVPRENGISMIPALLEE